MWPPSAWFSAEWNKGGLIRTTGGLGDGKAVKVRQKQMVEIMARALESYFCSESITLCAPTLLARYRRVRRRIRGDSGLTDIPKFYSLVSTLTWLGDAGS